MIRTNDTKKLADFYSLSGLIFEYHKHGNSPYHYSASIQQTTLEIYPLTQSQKEPDKNIRLGFTLDNFDLTIELLKSDGVTFLSEPSNTVFGFMTIVEDTDGRKITI